MEKNLNKNIAESLNNIIDIIENKFTDAGGDVHVDPFNLSPFKEETAYLKKRLGLEPFQAILFALIITVDANGRCSVNNVGKRLGMSYLKMLSYSKDLYALRDRGLIRMRGNNDLSVPPEVVDAVMDDKPFEKPPIEGMNTRAIIRRIASYLKRLEEGEFTPFQFVDEVETLLNANLKTSYAAACDKYQILSTRVNPFDKAIFHIMANLYARKDYTVFDMGDMEDFFKDGETMDTLRDFYDSKSMALQILEIIEPAQCDGMRDGASFKFKDEVVSDLFADIKIKTSTLKTIDLNDLAGKPVKQLFYNKAEREQIDRLGNLIEDESLKKVFGAMKEKGLRTGLICLFYGDPGTGKTETVYQMARRTGRKVMEADVAKLRNCYVGETEKNMRALFHDYRIACSENEKMPILLFNEADAILGTRMEGAVRAVDRMENSVQNILLQEMENFEGIMIATTNLLGNLDPAFERRFLFKIRFNKPELEPRSLIWKSQFPTLTDSDAMEIAREFSFSGGQIENVARKYTMDAILSGTEGGVDRLKQYCREESVSKTARQRIGF